LKIGQYEVKAYDVKAYKKVSVVLGHPVRKFITRFLR